MGAKAQRQRNLSCFLSPAAETGGDRCSGVPGVKESHEKEEEGGGEGFGGEPALGLRPGPLGGKLASRPMADSPVPA